MYALERQSDSDDSDDSDAEITFIRKVVDRNQIAKVTTLIHVVDDTEYKSKLFKKLYKILMFVCRRKVQKLYDVRFPDERSVGVCKSEYIYTKKPKLSWSYVGWENGRFIQVIDYKPEEFVHYVETWINLDEDYDNGDDETKTETDTDSSDESVKFSLI